MTRVSHPNKSGTSSRQWLAAIAIVAFVMVVLSRTQNIDDLVEHSAETSVKEEHQNPIRQISILGERNSGTRWTYE